MNLTVDKDKCIGCGMCVSTCEEVFAFDDENQAEVIQKPVEEENVEIATSAMESCPTGAIIEE